MAEQISVITDKDRMAVAATYTYICQASYDIWCAFRSLFTEEEKVRNPEFDQELAALFGKIIVDRDKLREIESDGASEVDIMLLKEKLCAAWCQVLFAAEDRGSVADKKFAQFIKATLSKFGITDLQSYQALIAKLPMDLFSLSTSVH